MLFNRRSGPVFCLLLGVSSDYDQPITGQVTKVICPVIWLSTAWAYSKQETENRPWTYLRLLYSQWYGCWWPGNFLSWHWPSLHGKVTTCERWLDLIKPNGGHIICNNFKIISLITNIKVFWQISQNITLWNLDTDESTWVNLIGVKCVPFQYLHIKWPSSLHHQTKKIKVYWF